MVAQGELWRQARIVFVVGSSRVVASGRGGSRGSRGRGQPMSGAWLLPRQPPQERLALEPHDAPHAGRRHRGVLLSPA
jgi:hypothetical protein